MAESKGWIAIAGVLAAGVVGSVAWLAGSERRGGALPERELREDAPVAALDVVRPEHLGDGRVQVEHAAPAVPADEAVVSTPESKGETEATWTMWGTLVRAVDATPAPHLKVMFGAEFVTTSDERGRFELELPVSSHPLGSLRPLAVMHGSGTQLLSEECVLEPGLLVRVDDEVVWLHGRVVDSLGAPIAVAGVSLACVEGRGVAQYLGRAAESGSDGSFRVPVPSVKLDCESVKVQVGVGQTVFPLSASIEALRSQEGATLVLDVCTLQFEVRAADGAGLEELDLRVVAWRRGAQRAEVIAFPELDSDGRAAVFVERDVVRVEVAAGARNCMPWIEEREAPRCGDAWRIELARYGPDDVLEGVVLDAGGRRVQGAFASCSPPSHDRQMVAVPAIRGVRTDSLGLFSLPFPAGETARVMAYHRDHGSTGEELVQGGRRDLVLRFRPVARLDVTVTTPDGDERGNEPARFALGLADGTWDFELDARGQVSFEQVPLGSHKLLCVSRDERWWLVSSVEVFHPGPQEVRRTQVPARWVEGTLVNGAGAALAGVEVRFLGAPLAPPVEWNPFVDVSDGQGRFRVLLGSEAEGELAFVLEGTELGRARLAAGEAGDVRVGD
ncbi:MAG TPA: hypothetical protein VMT18_10780 [Planctomycetota bacterium]|nr:hypothetical protein [Planctomycetota bacterium]